MTRRRHSHSQRDREILSDLLGLLTPSERSVLSQRGGLFTVESVSDFIHEDALRVLRGVNTPAPAQIRQVNTPAPQSLHPTLSTDPDSFWESLRGLPADEQLRRVKLRKDAA